MNRRTLGGLIVLNIALVAVLAIITILPSPAQAQFAGGRPGDYMMIATVTPGRPNYETVVITDVNNSAMLSLYYHVSRKQFVPIGYRDISADATAGARQGR